MLTVSPWRRIRGLGFPRLACRRVRGHGLIALRKWAGSSGAAGFRHGRRMQKMEAPGEKTIVTPV